MAGAFLLLEILVVILVAALLFAWMRWYRHARLRQKGSSAPPGFVRTEEIHIDPTTGVRQRVWYNERTGERWYETLE